MKYEEEERKKERESCSVRPTINKVPRDRVTPPFVMKLYGAVGGTNERTENGPASEGEAKVS